LLRKRSDRRSVIEDKNKIRELEAYLATKAASSRANC
jgi:hypothetical protein